MAEKLRDRQAWTDREVYYREALVNLLLNRVVWLEPTSGVAVPGFPEDADVRLGLIEACEPVLVSFDQAEMRSASHALVIAHDTTDDLIDLLTPYEIALWPEGVISGYAGLTEFLLAHVDVHRPRRNSVDQSPGEPAADSWLVEAGWELSDGFEDGSLHEY